MVQQVVDLVPIKVPDGNDVLYGYSPGSFLTSIGFPALITYLLHGPRDHLRDEKEVTSCDRYRCLSRIPLRNG
jgi:hypothetical protein